MTTERFTVADLKAAIAELPDDAPLFVEGYEGGYADMKPPVAADVQLDVHDKTAWWYGRHDDAHTATDTDVQGWVFPR